MSMDYSPSPYFIPPYRRFALPADERSECEKTGEHQGDSYEDTDDDGNTVRRWRCCDDEEITQYAEPMDDDEEPTP